MKVGSDKEIQAVYLHQKEQRLLEKRDSALRIEKEYAIKLLELSSREVKLSQRRLNTNVGKIKSYLSAEEIKNFRQQEMLGKFKPAINTIKISGAFTIAAASKRLKLQTEQRMAANGFDTEGNPLKSGGQRKFQKELTERLTKSAPLRRSTHASMREWMTRSQSSHHLKRSQTCAEFKDIDRVFNDIQTVPNTPKPFLEEPRSPTQHPEYNQPETKESQTGADKITTEVQKINPETNKDSPVPSQSMVQTNTDKLSHSNSIKFEADPKKVINAKAKSPTIGSKVAISTAKTVSEPPKPSSGTPKLAFSLAKLVNDMGEMLPETPKTPKAFFSVPVSARDPSPTERRKFRPATTTGSPDRARSKDKARSLTYSSHDIMERESRESRDRFQGDSTSRQSFSQPPPLTYHSIDEDLAITRANERRQVLLEEEEVQTNKLLDKQKEFLGRVKKWVDSNPGFQPTKVVVDPVESALNPEKITSLSFARERRGKDDKKKLKRQNTFSSKVVFKQRVDPIKVDWQELNKCRYLRIAEDDIDLSGVVTLASEQMKAYQTLQFRDVEEEEA